MLRRPKGVAMSPVHVRAEPGDFAESVLLPGDPLRAKYIAEHFFEGAELVTEERGMLGYTGTYGGKEVSVQATGMGCPSAAIVTEELIQLGARNLLRVVLAGGIVGSCGWGTSSWRLRRPRRMVRSPRSPWASLTRRRPISTSSTPPPTRHRAREEGPSSGRWSARTCSTIRRKTRRRCGATSGFSPSRWRPLRSLP